MNKKIIISLLLVLMIFSICLMPNLVSAEEEPDPVGTNASTFYINTKDGGELLINLGIENKKDEPITVELSSWYDYTHPDATQEWIDPEWLTSIEPATTTLPVGGQMIANIVYDIPVDADEIKYITWVKINVGGWWKPITVVIRKGVAAEDIDFAVSPSYYRVSVTSSGDAGNNWSDIKVINKCGLELLAYAEAEQKSEPLVIKADSSIQHTEEEVGNTYQNISTKQAQEWFTTSYTKDNPLEVKASSTGNLNWLLDVPSDVSNGKYVFGVRVGSLNESGGMMNIEYLVWIIVDVDRAGGSDWLGSYIWFIVLGGLVVAYIVVKRIRDNREELEPEEEELEERKD